MPCYHMLKAWRSWRCVSIKTGKPVIFFKKNKILRFGKDYEELKVKCGQCIGCRLDKARQWAIRCVHEASLYEDNCFVTLTYDEKHCPRSLKHSDFQKFMKRLRERLRVGVKQASGETRVRFYMCGEYGEKHMRPHFHVCLFGYDFPDKKFWSCRDGVRLYRSELLEELWKFGMSTIGEVTYESAAYVARYVMKKVTGENAEHYYDGRKPEYNRASNRRGIGYDWVKGYSESVYNDDSIVSVKGALMKPPSYYDRIYDGIDHSKMVKIKEARKIKAVEKNVDDSRMKSMETVKKAQVKKLKRGLHEADGV